MLFGIELYILVVLHILRQATGNLEHVEQHCSTWIVSQGLGLPFYIERMMMNDQSIYYYHSNLPSKPPPPDWLNSSEGRQHWNNINDWSDHNRHILTLGLEQAVLQFNKTDSLTGKNLYQSSGCCRLYPNGTYNAWLTHAFNGKDFIYFDIETKTYVPLVPQAVAFKHWRDKDKGSLEFAATYYKEICLKRLTAFKQAPGVFLRKVPEVSLLEKPQNGKISVTCHVTGFYPREIEVDWLDHDLHPQDVEVVEVLPNDDGTYQTRRTLFIPEEQTAHTYHCVVLHSSMQGNITKTWGKVDNMWHQVAVSIYMFIIIIIILTIVIIIGIVLYRYHHRGL